MGESERGNVKEGWSAWWSFARIPEFPVEAEKTALIVIDMTYQQAHRDYGLCKRIIEAGLEDDLSYYLDRIDRVVVPNLEELIAAFREVGAPVIYTRCASLVGDGSDQTWRHRHFGVVTTVDSKDAQILAPLEPQEGDIMLTKSGSAVFPSTNCEHLLRVKGDHHHRGERHLHQQLRRGDDPARGRSRLPLPDAGGLLCRHVAERPRQRGRVPRRQLLSREAHGGDYPPAGCGSRRGRLTLLHLPDHAVAGESRAGSLVVTDLAQDRSAVLAEGGHVRLDPARLLLELDRDAEV